MPDVSDKKFLHALLLTGAEYDSIVKIRQALPSYEETWRASFSALAAAGSSPECAEAIISSREKIRPDEEMRKLVSQSVVLITREDPEFPKELAHLASPPLYLYIKGRLDSKKPRLAVVGTRKATPYGHEAARKIIRDLAEKTDIVIVSGLAQGIDAEAHRAAMENNLATVGILGSGMDSASFYPPENWRLAEEIAANGGAVISEYPPGAPALKHHFIARNRIIAGLSAGTLVIEAPEKSGALITASFALEQGRDVFAVPGQMFSANASGVNKLIQDGAKLVTSADDIIDELGLERRKTAERIAASLTGENEKTILEILGEPASVDEIKVKTDLATPEIISCLSILELKGFIRPMGENKFQRIA